MVTLHTIINNHNYIRYYTEQRDRLSVGQHLMGSMGWPCRRLSRSPMWSLKTHTRCWSDSISWWSVQNRWEMR